MAGKEKRVGRSASQETCPASLKTESVTDAESVTDFGIILTFRGRRSDSTGYNAAELLKITATESVTDLRLYKPIPIYENRDGFFIFMKKKGLIHIYTGDGKGKTSAALGLAMRAAGSGKNVFFVQFFNITKTGQ